jgi:hypothetical protein
MFVLKGVLLVFGLFVATFIGTLTLFGGGFVVDVAFIRKAGQFFIGCGLASAVLGVAFLALARVAVAHVARLTQ